MYIGTFQSKTFQPKWHRLEQTGPRDRPTTIRQVQSNRRRNRIHREDDKADVNKSPIVFMGDSFHFLESYLFLIYNRDG